MGRVAGRITFYYWMSKKSGTRVGWLFPSRKEADKWRNAKYYKFKDYPTLEGFLSTVNPSRHIKETQLWNIHKEGWQDLILRKGVGIYD